MTTTTSNTSQTPSNFTYYIQLARLNFPTGWMFILASFLWGMALANHFNTRPLGYFIGYAVIFLILSILARGAGCIFNDTVNRNIDKNNPRTKDRPMALGVISVKNAAIFATSFAAVGLIILLITVNWITIILSIIPITMAVIYPFSKRFTYYPQVFLGAAFNFCLILGFTAMTGFFDPRLLFFYIGGIFWTLGYDSTYSYADQIYDNKNNAKSLAMKISKKPKLFISAFYGIAFVFLCLGIYSFQMLDSAYIFLVLLALISAYRVYKWDPTDSTSCVVTFKNNAELGFWIALVLLIT